VNFTGAQIAGDFDYSGGLAFHGRTAEDLEKEGIALELYDAKVGGDVKLMDGFRAFGQVRMRGAQIGRSLTCNDGNFVSVGQVAIDARGARVAGGAKFATDFRAQGGINISRMQVAGDLDCDGGRFITNGVDALSADLAEVGGQVLLGDGFYAEGEVRMINATVGGTIDCDSGTFHHPDGDALSLDGASIGRGLHVGTDRASASNDDEGPAHFVARGTVRLLGTKIGADIFCDGGEFHTPSGTAILANNVSIGSRAVITNAKATGTVDLSSAQVEHELDLRGSQFDGRDSPTGRAFVCDGIHVQGHVYSNRASSSTPPFRIDGQMSIRFATIGMHWDLSGAELVCPAWTALDASDTRVGGYINLDSILIEGRASFSRAKIDGMWVLQNVQRPERISELDLRFAHIWVIKDERLDDWPPAGQLKLEGLVYDHFDDDSPLDVEDRLAWLARQDAPAGRPRTDSTALKRLRPRDGARRVTAASFQQPVEDAGANSQDVAAPQNVGNVTDAATDETVRIIEDALEAASQPRPMMVTDDEARAMQMPAEEDGPAAQMAPPQMGAPPTAPEQAADPPSTPTNASNPADRRYVTQPYTQLAAVYRAIGQDEQANRVLVARAERLGDLSPPFSAHGIWYRYVGRLIGYGYEPFRAVRIGAAIVLLGAIVFAIGNRRNLMAETKLAEHVLSQESEPRMISPTYPRFNPLVYSLDVFLPFVDLQQICYWLPGESASSNRPSRNCLLHIGPWSLKWSAMLRVYLWFQTLAGWTLCTLLAAAVTGIVKS
jgi:hypothetical protein